MNFAGVRCAWFAYLLLFASVSSAAGETISGDDGNADEALRATIPALVQAQIDDRKLPGAVVLIGNPDRIQYVAAIGDRATGEPMSRDTIFDLASLTKVIATTTAVMQLAEQKKIALDSPAAHYWPAFGANGKGRITVRQLLAHTSGLRPDLDLKKKWKGRAQALRLIAAERPVATGGKMLYSDINFEVLGEIVQRVSGLPLERYCQRHIFTPLGMRDTGFRPARAVLARVAPTGLLGGIPQRGSVHDPTAFRMGGVAGHAGLFGSADDLARFARAMLNGGSLDDVRILRADTVAAMLTPQSPSAPEGWRGLGWKLEAPLVANRDTLPPLGAMSHTGYTGTAIWIDPVSRRFLVALSNRVYPDGKGDAGPLRSQLAETLAATQAPLEASDIAAAQPQLASYVAAPSIPATVSTGIDVLEQEKFAPIAGLRIGLITNQTGVDGAGRRTFDILRAAPQVRLAALFSPEHGLYGKLDEKVASGVEPDSGLPIFSLYGDIKRPSAAALDGLDALVFDIQDAGARFYTYSTTMAYTMEAAAQRGIPFFVLDRPNPIGADRAIGPLLDGDLFSFTGYFRLPVQHGMTVGELARLYNVENKIGADLRVIAMHGYRRDMWYDQTGLNWTAPSPNLRTIKQAALYSGVALVEGANVSVGRGTGQPFELLGAPWIDGAQLAHYLRGRAIPGVHFEATAFRPQKDRYAGILCRGIRVVLDDRKTLNAPVLGVELASALYALYPTQFQLDRTLGMVGSRAVLEAIRQHVRPDDIAAGWRPAVEQFMAMRAKYLIY